MKALSVLNPHAHNISTGEKHIERRSWSTEHRGPLLICSSRGWDRGAMTAEQSRNPIYRYGVALCIVDLIDVRPMTDDDTRAAMVAYELDAFAWVLANVRSIEPFPVMGRLKLFNVEVPKGWEAPMFPPSTPAVEETKPGTLKAAVLLLLKTTHPQRLSLHEIKIPAEKQGEYVSENNLGSRMPDYAREGFVVGRKRDGKTYHEWGLTDAGMREAFRLARLTPTLGPS